MYMRLAEVDSAAQVAREYGVNRSTVTYWWNKLTDAERQYYQNQVADAKVAAMEQQKLTVENNTKNYVENMQIVRDNLLSKLSLCINSIEPAERTALAKLKDASTTLQNLKSLSLDSDETGGENIFQKFTNLSKINEREN